MLECVIRESANPLKYFTTDETWFHLSDYTNSSEQMVLGHRKPTGYIIHEYLLHNQKMEVWCPLSGYCIITRT